MAEQEYPNAVIIHFLVSTKCITVQFMYFNYKVIIIVMVYMPTVICRHQTVISIKFTIKEMPNCESKLK